MNNHKDLTLEVTHSSYNDTEVVDPSLLEMKCTSYDLKQHKIPKIVNDISLIIKMFEQTYFKFNAEISTLRT